MMRLLFLLNKETITFVILNNVYLVKYIIPLIINYFFVHFL